VGESLTSALDFIAILVIATALFWLVGGGWGLLVAGSFILIGSLVASAVAAAQSRGSDT
jgi:hypothetical protein